MLLNQEEQKKTNMFTFSKKQCSRIIASRLLGLCIKRKQPLPLRALDLSDNQDFQKASVPVGKIIFSTILDRHAVEVVASCSDSNVIHEKVKERLGPEGLWIGYTRCRLVPDTLGFQVILDQDCLTFFFNSEIKSPNVRKIDLQTARSLREERVFLMKYKGRCSSQIT